MQSFVIITVLLLGLASPAVATANHRYVIGELAKSTYSGRQAGTAGYENAVTYLDGQMSDVGIQHVFNANNFRLPYTASAAVLTDETVSLNGRKLAIGVDYQPFAQSAAATATTTKTYYVGDGTAANYTGDTPGLVVFHWNRADGTFGGGVLDRIQIAISHGASAVAIIADGELAVSNFEHPLKSSEIKIPAIYLAPAAAVLAGIPSDHMPRTLLLASSISLKITRNSNMAADDLVGIVPGKLESHAILWVTNIDGFGILPDGRAFPGTKAASTAAAMMLDLAQHYTQSQPEFTQIFAFVGSKWSDQAGVKALAEHLNWSHIDTAVDVYAMGGSGARNRVNVNFTDPSFASTAHTLDAAAQLNTDLGNALSSVLSTYSKSTILLRDLDTWVNDSMADIPETVTDSAYSTGLQSLTSIADELMRVLTPTESPITSPPTFTPAQADPTSPTFQHTETDHFSIYTSSSDQPLFTPSLLNIMESIFKADDFYNYDAVSTKKVTALFIANGSIAAHICRRTDLYANPDAAGGGFANVNDGQPCVYQKRTGTGSEPIWFGNIAHELNHALATLQDFYPKQSDLQEWQGQSQFIRYDMKGQLPLTSNALVQTFFNFEVPKLSSLITNYQSGIDWAWFTTGTVNPDGWQYTYHIAGSMYGFLSAQYGIHASRRAMYRNYQDVTKFKENMIADTGLSFEAFCEQWSYWMLHSGAPKSPVSESFRASGDQNNSFDNLLLYTRATPVATTSGDSQPSGSNTSVGVYAGVSISSDGLLHLDLTGTSAADMNINRIGITQSTMDYEFDFALISGKSRDLAIFIPPDGILARATIKQGANQFQVNISKAQIANQPLLVLNFYAPDTNAFIQVDATSLTLAPASTIAAPKKVTVAPKKMAIKCIRGKSSRKVIAVKPVCRAGWKKTRLA
jgi:hypothetical protein